MLKLVEGEMKKGNFEGMLFFCLMNYQSVDIGQMIF